MVSYLLEVHGKFNVFMLGFHYINSLVSCLSGDFVTRHAANATRGIEVFVGGLPRNVDEEKIRQVKYIHIHVYGLYLMSNGL